MGSIFIGGKKHKSKVKAIQPGTVDPVHYVPSAGGEGNEEIDLSLLEGWNELSIDKQRYLVEFSRSRLKEKRAALSIGISTRSLIHWKQSDPIFTHIFNDIIDIHTEGVEEVEYLASYDPSNNTSRGRFLKQRSSIYKEDEAKKPALIGTQNNQTNVFAFLNSEEVTNKGLAGVQQAFNKLKNTSDLDEIEVTD